MTIARGPEDWTADRVQRFWDYQASREDRQGTYFGATAGPAVVHWLELLAVLRGRVLDFGCGPGLILERLCERPLECYGVDSSGQSILMARRRCQGRPGFRDVIQSRDGHCPWPDNSFDLIVCCETVEHVLPAVAAQIYEELWRLVKPEGYVLITTPACENLQQHTTYCPFCESEFHSWQHLRSISPAELRAELMRAGFDVRRCEAVELLDFDPNATLTRAPRLRRLVSWCWRVALRVLWTTAPELARRTELWLRTSPGPNLIALAQKRPSR